MTIEQIKTILSNNGISPKKMFGQNFLLDDNIINQAVEKSAVNEECGVIEIGPGLGFLTKKLLDTGAKVLCYEIDKNMIHILNKELKQYSNVLVLEKDVLKANINEDINEYFKDVKTVKVVANLPYYITSPILLKLLEEVKGIDSITCMVQKEVADRLCGKPSTKDYNALSVLVQYYTEAKLLINVPRNSFYTEPNVDSAVVKLSFLKERIHCENESFFKKFNRIIFQQRRKTLVNNLRSLGLSKETIEKVLTNNNIEPSVRAEALSVEQIVKLSDEFYKEVSHVN